MRVESYRRYRPIEAGTAVAIGNFDGVHLGHQALVRQLLTAAGPDAARIAMRFEPHTRQVLRPQLGLRLLTTAEETAQDLLSLGLQQVLGVPFDLEMASWPPQRFVDEVLVPLRPQVIAVGQNFRFGHGAAAGAEDLARFGQRAGFTVLAVPLVFAEGRPVSSSRIRQLVGQGEMLLVNRLLGRPYRVQGVVQHGDRRGRTLGFPTANLQFDERKVWPPFGVYAVRVDGPMGLDWPAVASFGVRPTFGSDHLPLLEVHLVDFSGELYDSVLTVHFYRWLRPERHFDGAAELISAMHEDLAHARDVLGVAGA